MTDFSLPKFTAPVRTIGAGLAGALAGAVVSAAYDDPWMRLAITATLTGLGFALAMVVRIVIVERHHTKWWERELLSEPVPVTQSKGI